MIYLDNVSTTKIDDRVLAEMFKYYLDEHYGNPSAIHSLGIDAEEILSLELVISEISGKGNLSPLNAVKLLIRTKHSISINFFFILKTS